MKNFQNLGSYEISSQKALKRIYLINFFLYISKYLLAAQQQDPKRTILLSVKNTAKHFKEKQSHSFQN